MADLVIIADDLTGALDAAAPFASRGIGTQVALGVESLPRALATDARIVSVSTGSRELMPEAAHTAVARALEAVPAGIRLFKKVDSRLKGNIEAELEAFTFKRALVVPAIPDFGRVTRAGHVEGFGVTQPIDIASRLGRFASRVTAPDVENLRDMRSALALPHDLVVGARGVAEALADDMASGAVQTMPELPPKPVYCVIGSTDPITLAQLEHFRARFPDMLDLRAPNGVVQGTSRPVALTVLQAVRGAAPAGAETVAANLGRSLVRLEPPSDAVLFVSGGATAGPVLAALGIDLLDLVGEVLPGLPMAQAGGLTVITKSGGFGEVDCLSRLFATLLSVRSAVPSHVG